MTTLGLLTVSLFIQAQSADPNASRLKDLVTYEGMRDNQLMGYGLVVGLAGTGDRQQSLFSTQSLTNLLERMGVTVSPTALQVKNMAGVMVTATLPPFAQPGTHIDVTVGAAGDARSLQGGLLLLTSLRGANGQVYAVAQGPVVINGFAAGQGGSTSATLNHPTVGRIPSGAIVERPAPSVPPASEIRLQLRQGDFTTAARIVTAVNQRFSGNLGPVARAENSALISVSVPKDLTPVEFMAELEKLTVATDQPLRVVINERSGTIVMGKEIRIRPVAILHGNLTVEIQTNYTVSQPAPLSQGQTAVVPQTSVAVKEEKTRNVILKQGATVEDLVRALGAIGSTPRDVIAILQNLQKAGALDAEIEVI
jgi:flagellar P-ring protein precursor FlgI